MPRRKITIPDRIFIEAFSKIHVCDHPRPHKSQAVCTNVMHGTKERDFTQIFHIF